MAPEDVEALSEGRCRTPFRLLGVHAARDGGYVVRAFVPWARAASLVREQGVLAMEPAGASGMYQAFVPEAEHPFSYRISLTDAGGRAWEVEDPYRFGPTLDEERARAFSRGEERRVHEVLGAAPVLHEGVQGTRFAVWAPHARAVNLMGDMNGWDGRCHPMEVRGDTGVWEIFVPGVCMGARYKYRILDAGGVWSERADPCGRAAELRPATASEVWDVGQFEWGDDDWMARRAELQGDAAPMSVYEVHLGSWRRGGSPTDEAGERPWLGYREIADELLPYVRDLGFTHVELLPLTEHPLDESWGYQPLGFFAPTSRYGDPDGLRHFVDQAHRMGLGVILDWVAGHFPEDGHGLARFDGTALFEHPDPAQARHPDWGTLEFNYASGAVRSFLISSALHWLEDYHVDGLRVDAVASMLYLDYSRPPGAWRPNREGGRENLEAVDFLRELNDVVHAEAAGALMIAEESTAWPRVSHGTDRGGLGFDQKWNMGWMNDTLGVMQTDALRRPSVYGRLTFSLAYAFDERFTLPLSHDEVVHGKSALLGKMPGPDAEKFANLRLLYAYMWTHPGKKLLFMGGELAQWSEWSEAAEVDWSLEAWPPHRGVRDLVRDLNRLYRDEPALHTRDFLPSGFEWLDCHDASGATIAYLRWGDGGDFVAVAANFSATARLDFRLAVPRPGRYRVLLDTDAAAYGGAAASPPTLLESRRGPLYGREQYIETALPALSVLIVKPE